MSPSTLPALHPMEHPDFTFSLINPRWSADHFATKGEAESFAGGIRESQVKPGSNGWVVQVGPWMFAHDIKPRARA